MQIDPTACRMARAALQLSRGQLAGEAKTSVGVIRDYEHGRATPHRNNLAAIVRAFERGGVEFLAHGARILVLPPVSPVPTPIAAD